MKRPILCLFAMLAGMLLFPAPMFPQAAKHSMSGPSRTSARVRADVPLELEEEIPIPNVAGRIDHFTADVKRKRVIFSALGNNSIQVVDVFAGKNINTITGVNEPQGVLYVPDVDKLFAANAGDGRLNIYNGGNYELEKTVDFGADPDNLRYDANAKQVLVGYGEDETGAIGAIDANTGERVREFKIGFHPESFQFETKGPHIFVNVPDAGNMVMSVDRKTGEIQKWPLKGLRGNYAMALNEADHRLYVVTRKVPMLVVLDTETGKEITRLPAAGECDDVFFDESRKRIYVIGGQGWISVYTQADPDHYKLLANVPSTVGVRTGYWFSKRDRFYVGVPAKGNEPAQVWTYEAED
jgi:DNA-binding beta-propeller fold protein YncE